jgi:hypothetical protein
MSVVSEPPHRKGATVNATTATSPPTATDDSLLRFALRADAVATGLCGLLHAAAGGPIASLTGLTPIQVYVLGAAFMLYGVVVYRLSRLPNVRTAGRWVIDANLLCTVGAVAVVATGVLPLTTAGVVLMLAMGVYTAAFAVLQYLGVRRLA